MESDSLNAAAFLSRSGGGLGDVNRYSPLGLAFIGDSVLELLTRGYLMKNGGGRTGDMTREAMKFLSANAQSEMYEKLIPVLTEDEAGALRRGRNANAKSHPKNASHSEYRRATGVEALFGWLYVKGRVERIVELFNICVGGS